jgi:hypothetical protein
VSGPPLPPRRWSLGRYGIAVNIGATSFLVVVWVFVFFPMTAEVNLTTMNWNVVIFVGTMTFSVVYYLVLGRHAYTAPVEFVKRSL